MTFVLGKWESINNSVDKNLCNPSLVSNFWLTKFTEYSFVLFLHYILLPDLICFIYKFD